MHVAKTQSLSAPELRSIKVTWSSLQANPSKQWHSQTGYVVVDTQQKNKHVQYFS